MRLENWFRFLSGIYRKVSGYLSRLFWSIMIDSVSVQEFCEIELNGTGGHKKLTKSAMLDRHIDSLKWAKSPLVTEVWPASESYLVC